MSLSDSVSRKPLASSRQIFFKSVGIRGYLSFLPFSSVKTNSDFTVFSCQYCAKSSNPLVSSESGTTCFPPTFPVFILSAGIVHSFQSRLRSVHRMACVTLRFVDPTTLPTRAAVRSVNSIASTPGFQISVGSTRFVTKRPTSFSANAGCGRLRIRNEVLVMSGLISLQKNKVFNSIVILNFTC